jgi:Diacylglycerol kinase
MRSPYKSTNGFSRLANALRYSMKGFESAFRHESAFRQEVAIITVLFPIALWIGRDFIEIAILIGSLIFVLTVELLNSAIEALADAVTLKEHPLIGRAKDLGSAAVLLSITLATLVWLAVIFQ